MSRSSERLPGLSTKPSGMLDISDEFSNMFQFPYNSFKDFEEDLAEFQLRTSTSYRITRCVTAGRWLRDKGEELPICFPYKYVSYYCVHKRKKQASAKCRFADYDCKASFCIAVCDDQLVLSKSHMLHSHDFHIGNPWMYARNRRLSARDEQEVSSLLDHCHSGAIVRSFVENQYGRRLTRQDLHRIRQRRKTAKGSADPEPETENQDTKSYIFVKEECDL